MPYILADKTFKTKETLTNYFKYILNNSELNESLTGQWKYEVIELIKQHSKAEEKIGTGIQSIVVEKHFDEYTQKPAKYPHFHIYRVDGSDIDFSYYKCIRNMKSIKGNVSPLMKSDKLIDVKKALRFEIKEYIYKFKKDYFGNCRTKKCQATDKRIAIAKAEVDHKYPITFDQLIFNFMTENNYKFKDIKLTAIDGVHNKLKDRKLAKEWYDYHAANCKLHVVAGWWNRTQEKSKGLNWEQLS